MNKLRSVEPGYAANLRDLVPAAARGAPKSLAVACPNPVVLEAVAQALQAGIIRTAWLAGDRALTGTISGKDACRYELIDIPADDPDFHSSAAGAAVEAVRRGDAQLLMKGDLHSAVFLKSVLNKERGIGAGRRLSLISIARLPRVGRLTFLTDVAVNPRLAPGGSLETSRDIVLNAVGCARAHGVEAPRVAIIDANEVPTDAVPSTMLARRVAGLDWGGLEVSGPLSYDLALYPEAVAHKGLRGDPVAGRADILVAPDIAAANILYKSWVMTFSVEVASIVVGARAPIVLTSRADNQFTKFISLCSCALYAEYQARGGEPA